jgi:hypothetical protein
MSERRLILQIPVSRAELEWLERAARVSGVTVEQLVHDALPLAGSEPEFSREATVRSVHPAGGRRR